MTDNDRPLAEQLRSAAEDMNGPLLPVSRMYMQLADRVEAYEVGIKQLSAEIDRLRLECQAQYDRGYYDGRQNDGAEERAKIVAYLRDGNGTEVAVADAIEAKEHLK